MLPLLACSFEEAAPGVRGHCATATGDPVCPREAVDNGEDACWKLVECAAIPLASPEDEDYFDQPFCLEFFERLSDARYDLAVACVSASTCDQLQFRNSPDGTGQFDNEGRPSCLIYGEE